jgi:hypothetical protein
MLNYLTDLRYLFVPLAYLQEEDVRKIVRDERSEQIGSSATYKPRVNIDATRLLSVSILNSKITSNRRYFSVGIRS